VPPDGENTRVLIDFYAHGLTQARRHSATSVLSAGAGVAAVIAGAMIAIVRSGTAGVTASTVVSVAGAITSTISVLVHWQANRALAHIEGQIQNLRQEMRTDRETRQAIHLLDNVTDAPLRNSLLAGVVLQLARAELPSVTVPTPQRRDLKGSAGLNGFAHYDAGGGPLSDQN
jgi:hypothetical protein